MKSTHKTGKINTHKDNISKVNINLYNKISIINNHSTINSRLRKRKNQYIIVRKLIFGDPVSGWPSLALLR